MTSQPDRPFSDPRQALRIRLVALGGGDERPGDRDRVIYGVTGGPPGKRLESSVEIRGTGSASARLLDELRGIERRSTRIKLPAADVDRIFRAVRDSQLLDQEEGGGPFLPDSVIGSISIEHGDSSATYYFAADAAHRQAQGTKLAPAIERLHPTLEDLASRLMKPAGPVGRKTTKEK